MAPTAAPAAAAPLCPKPTSSNALSPGPGSIGTRADDAPTSLDSEGEAVLVTLKGCLQNRNCDVLITRYTSEDFTANQLAVLRRIFQHFVQDERDSGLDEAMETRETERPRKRARTGARATRATRDAMRSSASPAKPRLAWAPFMGFQTLSNLSEDLVACLENQCYIDNPVAFLSDKAHLEHQVISLASASAGDAFLGLYSYTVQLKSRQGIDRIRWLVTMMCYYDLVKIIRPDASGKCIGEVQASEITTFLGSVVQHSSLTLSQTRRDLTKWSKIGCKLDHVCNVLGYGNLFYLVDYYSENFLHNKMCLSGPSFDSAMKHLQSIIDSETHADTDVHAQYTKAGQLVSGARSATSNVFKDLWEAQSRVA